MQVSPGTYFRAYSATVGELDGELTGAHRPAFMDGRSYDCHLLLLLTLFCSASADAGIRVAQHLARVAVQQCIANQAQYIAARDESIVRTSTGV